MALTENYFAWPQKWSNNFVLKNQGSFFLQHVSVAGIILGLVFCQYFIYACM